MLEKIKAFIDSHELILPGDKIIIACSGGSDSVALTCILKDLEKTYHHQLYLAHLHHGLRGTEADRDEAYVKQLSDNLQIPFFVARCEVSSYAKQQGFSLEEAGRILRYRFLEETAKQVGAEKIATGHHQDDQAETVLMNLLRGSGSSGLKGILPKNGNRIRPLLAVNKEMIQQYLTKLGIETCYDSTNTDQKILRNRLRLSLLPTLQLEYNNHIKESLCRTALIAQQEHDFLLQAAYEAYENTVWEEADGVFVSQRLQSYHKAVQREVFRLAIEKKQGHLRGISFHHVEQLSKMLFSWTVGTYYPLPQKLIAYKGYDTVKLMRQGTKREAIASTAPQALSIPGKTILFSFAAAIEAVVTTEAPLKADKNEAWFDYDALTSPLFIRSRQPGDRFTPSQMQGTQKIKKYLIDHKVPQESRDKVPILYNDQGILWLCGLRQSALAAVSAATRRFLKLSLVYQEDL
ncbi:MAG: tRNA lysidine(34) synthetase TilS [Sporomusaceae bacterium]|nr:tRNA lysidine(34) synthetase TilS [Sporomusaceae bacterium]